MFQFERLCFCTQENNYQPLTGEEGNPETLHMYEIISGGFPRKDEVVEGPFSLKLLTNTNPGNHPVVYELQDPNFNKTRLRNTFRWRILPPSMDIAALEETQSYIHRLSACIEFPDDTDSENGMFKYYKKIFSSLDDNLSEDKKREAVHYGNRWDHWRMTPCHRIKLVS